MGNLSIGLIYQRRVTEEVHAMLEQAILNLQAENDQLVEANRTLRNECNRVREALREAEAVIADVIEERQKALGDMGDQDA